MQRDMDLPDFILFDLDGTLLDNSELVVDAYYTGMTELGYPVPPREEIHKLAGKSTFETGRALGLEEDDLDDLDNWFWQYFDQYCATLEESVPVIPGVREVLQYLSDRTRGLAVVTSNSRSNAQYLLGHVGIRKEFDAIVGKEDTDLLKPDPAPIMYALEQLHADQPGRTWFVGDTAADITAAKRAGTRAIAIPQKHSRRDVSAAEPHLQFENMMDFHAYLQNYS